MSLPNIFLRSGRENSVLRKHPWVFSGAIQRVEGAVRDGDIVHVKDCKGNFLAVGHYFEGSISVKILSFQDEKVDAQFWLNGIQKAYDKRVFIGISSSSLTNTYRLVNGEGDDLPGLIADVYGDVIVLQAHSIGMYRALGEIVLAIKNVYGSKITAIYDKSKECLPPQFASNVQNSWLYGQKEDLIVLENGIKFHIDVSKGQKTGFFIDQRENRALLTVYSKGKSVLNAFCYSGGFSLAALNSEATQVDSVDVSANAIDLTDKNVILNNFSTEIHHSHTEDVMKFLRKEEVPQYDIVIIDPPAFAKSISKRHNAVQGYKRLNVLGINKVKPGGLLFTFSCSQVVDASLFLNTITAAAIESGRKVKVLHSLSHAPDHPVNIFHPEGSYLKGLVLMVE